MGLIIHHVLFLVSVRDLISKVLTLCTAVKLFLVTIALFTVFLCIVPAGKLLQVV